MNRGVGVGGSVAARHGAARRGAEIEDRALERGQSGPPREGSKEGNADRGDRLSQISCESGVAPCAAALTRCQLPEPCATVRTACNRHHLHDDAPKLATGHHADSRRPR